MERELFTGTEDDLKFMAAALGATEVRFSKIEDANNSFIVFQIETPGSSPNQFTEIRMATEKFEEINTVGCQDMNAGFQDKRMK